MKIWGSDKLNQDLGTTRHRHLVDPKPRSRFIDRAKVVPEGTDSNLEYINGHCGVQVVVNPCVVGHSL